MRVLVQQTPRGAYLTQHNFSDSPLPRGNPPPHPAASSPPPTTVRAVHGHRRLLPAPVRLACISLSYSDRPLDIIFVCAGDGLPTTPRTGTFGRRTIKGGARQHQHI